MAREAGCGTNALVIGVVQVLLDVGQEPPVLLVEVMGTTPEG